MRIEDGDDSEKARPVGLKLGVKRFECINRPGGEGGRDESIDVPAILKANQNVQAVFEEPVDCTPRRSRRKRDYWTVLMAGNALLAGAVAVLPKNPMVLVCGLSGVVLFSIGVTWVMWVVMGDY